MLVGTMSSRLPIGRRFGSLNECIVLKRCCGVPSLRFLGVRRAQPALELAHPSELAMRLGDHFSEVKLAGCCMPLRAGHCENHDLYLSFVQAWLREVQENQCFLSYQCLSRPLADRAGFEPAVAVTPRTLSKRVP